MVRCGDVGEGRPGEPVRGFFVGDDVLDMGSECAGLCGVDEGLEVGTVAGDEDEEAGDGGDGGDGGGHGAGRVV